MKLPQKASFGSETCEIGPKVAIWGIRRIDVSIACIKLRPHGNYTKKSVLDPKRAKFDQKS